MQSKTAIRIPRYTKFCAASVPASTFLLSSPQFLCLKQSRYPALNPIHPHQTQSGSCSSDKALMASKTLVPAILLPLAPAILSPIAPKSTTSLCLSHIPTAWIQPSLRSPQPKSPQQTPVSSTSHQPTTAPTNPTAQSRMCVLHTHPTHLTHSPIQALRIPSPKLQPNPPP